jgi:hypothetical protein
MQTFQDDLIYFLKILGQVHQIPKDETVANLKNCDIYLAIYLFALQSKYLRCFGINTTVRTLVSNNQDVSQSVHVLLGRSPLSGQSKTLQNCCSRFSFRTSSASPVFD